MATDNRLDANRGDSSTYESPSALLTGPFSPMTEYATPASGIFSPVEEMSSYFPVITPQIEEKVAEPIAVIGMGKHQCYSALNVVIVKWV
jgi:hypothetical protein